MMTQRAPGIAPPLPEDWRPVHATLAAALAAFQKELPEVPKGAQGQVRGRSDYRYADMADVAKVVLPKLGAVGLCFTTFPTVVDNQFGLSYSLQHESGEHLDGFYPLPDPTRSGPQEIGSAISYARRYALSAVTGIAPDEDDDGAAAQQAHQARNAPQRPPQGQPRRPEPPRRTDPEPEIPEHVLARGLIGDWVRAEYLPDHVEQGFIDVARAYHALYGVELGQETDVNRLSAALRALQRDGLTGLLPGPAAASGAPDAAE